MMKNVRLTIGLILIVISFFACKSNSDQMRINNYSYQSVTSNLSGIPNFACFVDDKTGFIASLGKIGKTVDGGVSWRVDSITDVPIYSIFFVDENVGFAVGGQANCGGTGCTPIGSVVYKTINAGATWTKQIVPYLSSELNSVFFVNNQVGFAVGLGLQLKTTNGGITWVPFEFEFKGLMDKIAFVNSQTGFAMGLFGNVIKTVDQGQHWIKAINSSDGHIYDFCFASEQVGYAAGQKEIVKTIDGGNTWSVLPGSPSEIYFIHFADEKQGVAIGKGHYTGGDWGTWTSAIYCTSDGGSTWQIEDNVKFGSVASFYSGKAGYSVVNNATFKITMK